MADLFTPPKSKSNASRKSCCCHWGDNCCQLATFFSNYKDHPLRGEVNLRYSDSCGFHNILRAAVNFLKIPRPQLREWEEQYNQHLADDKKPLPRIRIARHHFPLDLLEKKPRWLMPLTNDVIQQLESYKNRSPPPNSDSLLLYDRGLGSGQSNRSRMDHGDDKLFRVAPFVVLKDVQAIAAALQNGGMTHFGLL